MDIDISALPTALKNGYNYTAKVLGFHRNWNTYDNNAVVKKAVDMYFSKLDEFLRTANKKAITPARKEPTKKEARQIVKKEKAEKKVKPEPIKKPAPASDKKAAMRQDIDWVERIPEELRFMKRYINMDNKTKTYDQVRNLINAMQRAILEKRIRKTSAYAKQIEYTQKKLIELYNGRKGESTLVKIPANSVKEFSELIKKERI